jgi:hypothetical protein
MIYIGIHDGSLPTVFVMADNKVEAKDMVCGYYQAIETDVLKKDIMIHKPEEFFDDKHTKEVIEIPFV